MDDEQLLRYSRQILLPQIGYDGQRKLLESRVLLIGAGGLGSPVALYLAAAGVGHLTIADDDVVDLSNLQRQILHRHQDLGRPKVDSASDSIVALNPDVRVTPLRTRITGEQLAGLVQEADLVIDASDNFATRFAINEACVQLQRRISCLSCRPVAAPLLWSRRSVFESDQSVCLSRLPPWKAHRLSVRPTSP